MEILKTFVFIVAVVLGVILFFYLMGHLLNSLTKNKYMQVVLLLFIVFTIASILLLS